MSTTFGQQCGRGNGEAGFLHVLGVRGPAAQSEQPRKDVLADNGVDVARLEILEAVPAALSDWND